MKTIIFFILMLASTKTFTQNLDSLDMSNISMSNYNFDNYTITWANNENASFVEILFEIINDTLYLEIINQNHTIEKKDSLKIRINTHYRINNINIF